MIGADSESSTRPFRLMTGRKWEAFKSVSALAPICAPMRCPSGVKASTDNLIDQGLADNFLAEQPFPVVFEAACAQVGRPLTLRRHADYDHGYYFIAMGCEDQLRHHAQALA